MRRTLRLLPAPARLLALRYGPQRAVPLWLDLHADHDMRADRRVRRGLHHDLGPDPDDARAAPDTALYPRRGPVPQQLDVHADDGLRRPVYRDADAAADDADADADALQEEVRRQARAEV